MMKRDALLIAGNVLCLSLLAGCAPAPKRVELPENLSLPARIRGAEAVSGIDAPEAIAQRETRQRATPSLPTRTEASAGFGLSEDVPPLAGQPLSVNVDNLPIPAFINEVFGNLLGLNFQIAPDVSALQELVTLRTSRPLPPEDLFRMARQVLADYGIAVVVEEDLLRVRLAQDGARVEPPLILSGRALPDVPVSHRPIYQLVTLEATRTGELARWLGTIFGNEVKIEEDSLRNALMISGRPSQVRQALDAIRVFDRPFMRGRASTRLEPAFMSASELSSRLVEVLNAEGYGAANSLGVPASILVLSLNSVNAVLIFTSTRELLNHAVQWARELDRPNPAAGARSLFYYQIKNTKAADIAGILGGSGAFSTPRGEAGAAAAPAPAASVAGQSYSLLVDEPRNALIFQGDPAEWERLLPLVRQMDKAPRQVMIEVTIAEVSLGDNESFGFSWFAKAGFGRFNGNLRFGSLPGQGEGNGNGDGDAGSGSTGLTYLLDVAGQNRAALTAFAQDERVTILSTPRILVKSGQEANIDIGTEVPTITAQTTSNQQTGGSTNLLQSIQYRKTGIILNVKPTVYSDDRIDLDISQEVSDALPIGSGGINSPSIFNRSVSTSLSLRDGGSIVLGGLMETRQTLSDSGIPRLKDVPLLGNLFKSKSRDSTKTELVLMIVPYIIETDEQAQDVSRAIGEQLELLDLPVSAPAAQRGTGSGE